MSLTFCVLDYETFSEVDLKKVGAFEYSRHPSTEVLCAAWRVGTRKTLRTAPVKSWCPLLPGQTSRQKFDTLTELVNAITTADFVVAHNALFEQVITKHTLARYGDRTRYERDEGVDVWGGPERWICTASLAAALALPRNLEGACQALKLPVQKDMDGRRLMLKWCKPKKPSKKDPSTRHQNPAELQRLVDYCVKDVEAETELFLTVPPLTPTERQVWILDQRINLRGFQVDRQLVETVLELISAESKHLNKRTAALTSGVLSSATQRDGVLKWLEDEGAFLPNLQKKTVEDALGDGLVDGRAAETLRIRQAISKTSTAKYVAFEQRSRTDGRLRDILIYHTASTGRWGGAGVQPQNFPRGSIKDTIQAAEILKDGDLELVRMIYGDPMEVFSSCLRGMIVAPEGHTLDVADYAAIEARVLFWVAKHEDGIKAFRDGRKLYEELAVKIFQVALERVNTEQRFVGKQATLGCGYAMGWKKFRQTCLQLGQDVSDSLAQAAVAAYREAHAPVVRLWSVIEKAAIAAVGAPGTRFSVNRTAWSVSGGFLWCELPSGRRLAYREPVVRYEPTPWGDKRPVLYHWGIDTLSKKWTLQKTYGGKLVENVVQAISRDLMAAAMLRIDKTGHWNIVLSVHDELIAERQLFGGGSNKEFCNLMAALPPWAEGCPVKVEGWEGIRYRK